MPAALTDTQKQTFLDMLAKCGVVSDALKAAGVASRVTINKYREQDQAFSDAYDEAIEESRDTLESEARRRAVEGVVRIKWVGKGDDREPIEEVTYSDTLLLALLKAERSDKFADRSKSEITNPDGSLKPINETEAAARLAAILDAARQRKGNPDDAEDLLS